MNYRFLVIALGILMTSCRTIPKPNYYSELKPCSQVPGHGVLFTTPYETGWYLFDPDGKGAVIMKRGRADNESYAISLDYYQYSYPKSEKEFIDIYNMTKNREIEPPRYIAIRNNEEIDRTKGKYFMYFYYLTEDHEARGKASDRKYMFLEVMGFFAFHPEDDNLVLRVAYSNRYSPGHEDPEFRRKAKWVLDQSVFAKP